MSSNPGKYILLTRPEEQSAEFERELHPLVRGRATIISSPMMEILPVGGAPDLEGIGALVFTSANAVNCYANISDRRDLIAYCVGENTANAARSVGLEPQVAGGDAHSLLPLLRKNSSPLLHVCGEDMALDLAQTLRQEGQDVRRQVVYRQVPCHLSLGASRIIKDSGNRVSTIVFSAKAAAQFGAETQRLDLPSTTMICLSQRIADALGENFSDIRVASFPDRQSITREIAAWLDRKP